MRSKPASDTRPKAYIYIIADYVYVRQRNLILYVGARAQISGANNMRSSCVIMCDAKVLTLSVFILSLFTILQSTRKIFLAIAIKIWRWKRLQRQFWDSYGEALRLLEWSTWIVAWSIYSFSSEILQDVAQKSIAIIHIRCVQTVYAIICFTSFKVYSHVKDCTEGVCKKIKTGTICLCVTL